MKQLASLFFGVLVACGGGSGDGVDEFVGTWTYQAGSTNTLDCVNNQLDRTSPETGMFTVTEGSDSDLLVDDLDTDDPCPPTKVDVSDGVASAVAGQTCTQTTSNGATIMLTDQTIRATIDNGGTMTITSTAKVAVSGSVNTTCTATVTATAKQ